MGKHYNKAREETLESNLWHWLALEGDERLEQKKAMIHLYSSHHDINTKNEEGYTALHIAAASIHGCRCGERNTHEGKS